MLEDFTEQTPYLNLLSVLLASTLTWIGMKVKH